MRRDSTTPPRPLRFLVGLLGLALLLAGCDDGRLLLAPIGAHSAHVGQTWVHRLHATGSLVPPLHWRLKSGPKGLQLQPKGPEADLVWTPDAFALGPSKPGQARVPGPVQPLAVEVEDAGGQIASSQGTIQVVPVLLPLGIDAPGQVALQLDQGRVVRVPIRTDTTDLLGAAVQLVEEPGLQADLLHLAKGQYLLRYRASDADLQAGDRRIVRLQALSPLGVPLAKHDLEIRLDGRWLAVPCALDPPVVTVPLPPTSAQVTDAQGPIAAVTLLPQVPPQGPLPTVLGVEAEALAGLLSQAGQGAFALQARDLDDPWFAVCSAENRWPLQGLAVVPACPEAQARALALGAQVGGGLCPGQPDGVTATVPAGQAALLRLDTPTGWPTATAVVTLASKTMGLVTTDRPLALPAADQARDVQVAVTGQAATAYALRLQPLTQVCTLAQESQALLSSGQALTLALCPGEVRRLTLGQAARLVVTSPEGNVDLLGPVFRQALAGRTEAMVPAGEVRLGNPGDRPVQALVQALPPQTPAAWLDPLTPAAWLDPLTLGPDQPVRLAATFQVPIDLRRPRLLRAELAAGDELTLELPGVGHWQPVEPLPDHEAVVGLPLPVTTPEVWVLTEPLRQRLVAVGPGLLSLRWTPPVGQQAELLDLTWLTAPGCQDWLDTAAQLQPGPPLPQLAPPGPRPTVLAGLRVCPNQPDVLQIPVEQDQWLEVSASAVQPGLTLEVSDAQTWACQAMTALQPAPPGLQPQHRQAVRCWPRQAGVVTVQITAPVATVYDLAVRAR